MECKKAFTVAETLIVLVVLGIVASLTIPTLIQRQTTMTNRTKVKRAIADYDKVIQSIVIENDLRSGDALAAWDSAEDNTNCEKTSQYFKISQRVSEESSCKFKTSDGLWWNIDDIMKPIISLKEDELDDTTKDTTFQLVTSYDANAKAFRTDDLAYESKISGETASLTKLFAYVNDEEVPESQWLLNFSKSCTTKGCSYSKYDYDSKGNKTVYYYNCDSSGNNCTKSMRYDYDSFGNVTTYYYSCDGSGNNCKSSEVVEYDNDGKKLAFYTGCDGNGNNCTSISSKYEYDSNGNQTAMYAYCDIDGNNCTNLYKRDYDDKGNLTAMHDCRLKTNYCSVYTYDYDDKGNAIAYHYGCDSDGNNCSATIKYDYDNNGKTIANYSGCDGDGNNCTKSNRFIKDSNGNSLTDYMGCDINGENCRYTNQYKYDSNGNQTAYYELCDMSGNNCSSSRKYEYDSNGNQITTYYNCDGNGNNCKTTNYNSYIELK